MQCRHKFYYRNLKLRMLKYKGHKCQHCGYSEHQSALDFHHINPEEKDFNVTTLHKNWDIIKSELDKCVVLCANCHGEVHSYNDFDIDKFEELKSQTVSFDLTVRERTCMMCGKHFLIDKKKNNSGRFCASCRSRYYETKHKLKVINGLGRKCEICGYDRNRHSLCIYNGMLLCMNCFREERVKKDVDLSKLEEWLNREHKESQKEKNARLAKLHGIPLDRLKGKSLGSRKVIRPTYEQFLKEMKELNWNYSAMGRKYGVSDNAIRRWKESYETETR